MDDAHVLHHDHDGTDVFGFWLYIMSDCILFATLFATFIVLNYQSDHGPLLKTYINLPDVLLETFILLFSNLTFCLALLQLYRGNLHRVQWWLLVTFMLGVSFLWIEIKEFIHLAHEGFRWNTSGQASGFFTLVGTHGLHVACGLIWIFIMMMQLTHIPDENIRKRRMTYLGMFWNFLDIVWIFVFSIVYLLGAI